MIFLFTKNNLIGSKAIRWGLGNDCSHFAIMFESPEAVYESRLESGCGRDTVAAFLKRNRVVHSLELTKTDSVFEKNLRDSLEKNSMNCRYDSGAILFWAIAALGKRLFGLPLPQKNPWGKGGEHYCVEIIRGSEHILDDYLGTDFSSVDIEMTSPHMAYLKLRNSKKLRHKS